MKNSKDFPLLHEAKVKEESAKRKKGRHAKAEPMKPMFVKM